METYIYTAGYSIDQDYSWFIIQDKSMKSAEGDDLKKLDLLFEEFSKVLYTDKYGFAILYEENNYYLFIVGIDSERKDLKGRGIRDSILLKFIVKNENEQEDIKELLYFIFKLLKDEDNFKQVIKQYINKFTKGESSILELEPNIGDYNEEIEDICQQIKIEKTKNQNKSFFDKIKVKEIKERLLNKDKESKADQKYYCIKNDINFDKIQKAIKYFFIQQTQKNKIYLIVLSFYIKKEFLSNIYIAISDNLFNDENNSVKKKYFRDKLKSLFKKVTRWKMIR